MSTTQPKVPAGMELAPAEPGWGLPGTSIYLAPKPERVESSPRVYFDTQLEGQNPELHALAKRIFGILEKRGFQVVWGNLGAAQGRLDLASLTLSLDYKWAIHPSVHPVVILVSLYHEMIHVLNSSSPVWGALTVRPQMSEASFIEANFDAQAKDEARAGSLGYALGLWLLKNRVVSEPQLFECGPGNTEAGIFRAFSRLFLKHGQSDRLSIVGNTIEEVGDFLKKGKYADNFRQNLSLNYRWLESVSRRQERPLESYNGITVRALRDLYYGLPRSLFPDNFEW
jgi:hypothetical protein